MVIILNKLILKYPTLDELKEELSKEYPEEIKITFESKEDNAKELEIIFYLVNVIDYFFEKLTPLDDSRTTFIGYFKRKS